MLTNRVRAPADPVFLASQCGEGPRAPPSATALSTDDAHDHRLWSLDAAVEFAKMNNLLGVLLNAGLLVGVILATQGWAWQRHSMLTAVL